MISDVLRTNYQHVFVNVIDASQAPNLTKHPYNLAGSADLLASDPGTLYYMHARQAIDTYTYIHTYLFTYLQCKSIYTGSCIFGGEMYIHESIAPKIKCKVLSFMFIFFSLTFMD